MAASTISQICLNGRRATIVPNGCVIRMYTESRPTTVVLLSRCTGRRCFWPQLSVSLAIRNIVNVQRRSHWIELRWQIIGRPITRQPSSVSRTRSSGGLLLHCAKYGLGRLRWRPPINWQRRVGRGRDRPAADHCQGFTCSVFTASWWPTLRISR